MAGSASQPEVLVLGVGNPLRGDDGAGVVAARLLRERLSGGATIREVHGDAMSLVESWRPSDHVVVIDATCSGAPAGTIVRLDALARELPAELLRGSTHSLGVAESVELARALDRLPSGLVVFGIEGECFEIGVTELSTAVGAQIDALVDRVVDEVAQATNGKDPDRA